MPITYNNIQRAADTINKAIRDGADKIHRAHIITAAAHLVASGKSEAEAVAIVKRLSEIR